MKLTQINIPGRDVNTTINNNNSSKSFLDHLFSWYGILTGTVTIVGFWTFGWKEWHWWFFGL